MSGGTSESRPPNTLAENLDRMEPGLIGLQLDRTDNVVNSSFRFKFAEQTQKTKAGGGFYRSG